MTKEQIIEIILEKFHPGHLLTDSLIHILTRIEEERNKEAQCSSKES